MSNRTDFGALVEELAEMYGLPPACLERLETELHNAYVAGEDGNGCECRWCEKALKDRIMARMGAPDALPWRFFDGMTREEFEEMRDRLPATIGTYDDVQSIVAERKRGEER